MYCYNDSWNVIFKNDGKPLVGKIEFCDPVTTELKTIYDVDHEELTNPIYCNGIPSHQVMLDNGDYTVRYYEYIGNGNMESDENEASWHLYKTELVKQNVVEAANDTTGITATCTTIDQLKETEVPSDGTVVGVVGYYTAEDCPLRYYVWHETGNYTEDGGIVIRSNHTTTGAWVMKIPGTYIDVRWYGDIPDNDSSAATSSLGQRVKAAQAANKYDKDLYFPAYSRGNSNGFYMFDGSNTVSVEKNIICDWSVRFVVKEGTSGTRVTCKEMQHNGNYLFISEYGHSIGQYELIADWIRTSWYNTDKAVAAGARIGYIIDTLRSPLRFVNTRIKVENDVNNATFDNCEIVECYKQLTGIVTMENMVVNTLWFPDDYTWGNANFTNCKFILKNCRDANEYIKLKNKVAEYDYGDLGEQEIDATIHGGALLENFSGTVKVTGNGNIEIHNASVSISGVTPVNYLNLIDTWITFTENTVVNGISLRRGQINSNYLFQSIGEVLIEGAEIYCPLITLGQKATIRNCDIYRAINATDIVLDGNRIYEAVYQRDVNGIITADVCNNYFKHGTNYGIHSIAATTQNSKVMGRWINNKCDYDNAHWILVDRTNLLPNDYEHDYSYIGNEEPWMEYYDGSCWEVCKYCGDRNTGRGIFATSATPFIFWNTATNAITVVNRQFKWRMFTVGSKNTVRTARLWLDDRAEGNDNTPMASIVLVWDKVAVSVNGSRLPVINAICNNGYEWSFEATDADHSSVYSDGVKIGYFIAAPNTTFPLWATYPAEPPKTYLCVNIDKDFESKARVYQSV